MTAPPRSRAAGPLALLLVCVLIAAAAVTAAALLPPFLRDGARRADPERTPSAVGPWRLALDGADAWEKSLIDLVDDPAFGEQQWQRWAGSR